MLHNSADSATLPQLKFQRSTFCRFQIVSSETVAIGRLCWIHLDSHHETELMKDGPVVAYVNFATVWMINPSSLSTINRSLNRLEVIG